jgi:hypothetical protein
MMNESAFHFCGRWIPTSTVFHFPKSTSTVGIPDFFRVWNNKPDNTFFQKLGAKKQCIIGSKNL